MVSGIVFGDESMHDLLHLTRADFVALFEAAQAYIAMARAKHPEVDCFLVFMNGGRPSAASVLHPHLQVVGRPGRHFEYAEAIAACGKSDYWQRSAAVHAEIGLSITDGVSTAWATLVPLKDRDVTGISATLKGGAALMHDALTALLQHGTNTFSLAAIVMPSATPVTARFEGWPSVVWRLIDRGDALAPHADIGCMELFGTSVVTTDPFMVAQWLQGRC
jgi:hypothetical protein